jgi:hypothetical protein
MGSARSSTVTEVKLTRAARARLCLQGGPRLWQAGRMRHVVAILLVCTGGVIAQSGGPPICVLRFGSITVAANRTDPSK